MRSSLVVHDYKTFASQLKQQLSLLLLRFCLTNTVAVKTVYLAPRARRCEEKKETFDAWSEARRKTLL
jgi:hypothetical protein